VTDGSTRGAAAPAGTEPTQSDDLDELGPAAPPRANGELAFSAPWESRAFGMAAALVDERVFTWSDFRRQLIAAIAAWEAQRPDEAYDYYERWLVALESLVDARRLVSPAGDEPPVDGPGAPTVTAVVDIDIEAVVRQALEASGQAFEVLPCDPDFADTAAFCARYGVAMEDSANAILVIGKSNPPRYVCCVVLATTRLDVNGAVRSRLGVRKASFASAVDTEALTGMTIGGVTPFALPAEIPVWVDSRVMDREQVVLGGGSRSSKVRVAPAVFRDREGTEVVEGLAQDLPAP
jgi:nitrile hydratase accessory protein